MKLKRILKIAILCIISIIAVGYLSNQLSKTACEKRAVAKISEGTEIRDVFIRLDDYPDSEILANYGYRVRKCTAVQESKEGCFPWAGIRTVAWRIPFIIYVEWGWVDAPLSGLGGHCFSFCFLGLTVPIQDSEDWVS